MKDILKKFTWRQGCTIWIIMIILYPFLVFFLNNALPFRLCNSSPDFPTFLGWSLGIIELAAIIVWIACGISCLFNEDRIVKEYWKNEFTSKSDTKSISISKFLRYSFTIILLIFIIKWSSFGIQSSYGIYNRSTLYHNAYNQKTNERIGFYDKLWKTYLTKEKITNVNKETFIEVSKIIMENRKDGQNVTWKWLQENQQIPYSEFVKFYEDLSNFIESQREGYYQLEIQCQNIATANNILLDTFPNNMYNKLLKCEHIKFEYGYLSDSTNNVFNSKKENLK